MTLREKKDVQVEARDNCHGALERYTDSKYEESLNPLISVVIPSYNSMSQNERIDRLVSAILAQSYKNSEIVVVDNFSSDDTKETCQKLNLHFFQLRSTISEARNFGLVKARGDFVIFLDCDQFPSPKLFEECIYLAQHKGAECVVVEIECVPLNTENKRFLINCADMHNLEVDAKIGTTGTRFPLFYSTKLTESLRFPEKVNLGEDFVFALSAIRKKPTIAKAHERIIHFEDPSIKALVNRSWHYGRAFVSLQKKSPEARMFLRNISIFDFNNSKRLFYQLSSKRRLIFPFACYLLIKYVSFAMGYLSEKLSV